MKPNYKVHFDASSNETVGARSRSKTYFMLDLSDVDQTTIMSAPAIRAAGGMAIHLSVLHGIVAAKLRGSAGQRHINEVRQFWDGRRPTKPHISYSRLNTFKQDALQVSNDGSHWRDVAHDAIIALMKARTTDLQWGDGCPASMSVKDWEALVPSDLDGVLPSFMDMPSEDMPHGWKAKGPAEDLFI